MASFKAAIILCLVASCWAQGQQRPTEAADRVRPRFGQQAGQQIDRSGQQIDRSGQQIDRSGQLDDRSGQLIDESGQRQISDQEQRQRESAQLRAESRDKEPSGADSEYLLSRQQQPVSADITSEKLRQQEQRPQNVQDLSRTSTTEKSVLDQQTTTPRASDFAQLQQQKPDQFREDLQRRVVGDRSTQQIQDPNLQREQQLSRQPDSMQQLRAPPQQEQFKGERFAQQIEDPNLQREQQLSRQPDSMQQLRAPPQQEQSQDRITGQPIEEAQRIPAGRDAEVSQSLPQQQQPEQKFGRLGMDRSTPTSVQRPFAPDAVNQVDSPDQQLHREADQKLVSDRERQVPGRIDQIQPQQEIDQRLQPQPAGGSIQDQLGEKEKVPIGRGTEQQREEGRFDPRQQQVRSQQFDETQRRYSIPSQIDEYDQGTRYGQSSNAYGLRQSGTQRQMQPQPIGLDQRQPSLDQQQRPIQGQEQFDPSLQRQQEISQRRRKIGPQQLQPQDLDQRQGLGAQPSFDQQQLKPIQGQEQFEPSMQRPQDMSQQQLQGGGLQPSVRKPHFKQFDQSQLYGSGAQPGVQQQQYFDPSQQISPGQQGMPLQSQQLYGTGAQAGQQGLPLQSQQLYGTGVQPGFQQQQQQQQQYPVDQSQQQLQGQQPSVTGAVSGLEEIPGQTAMTVLTIKKIPKSYSSPCLVVSSPLDSTKDKPFTIPCTVPPRPLFASPLRSTPRIPYPLYRRYYDSDELFSDESLLDDSLDDSASDEFELFGSRRRSYSSVLPWVGSGLGRQQQSFAADLISPVRIASPYRWGGFGSGNRFIAKRQVDEKELKNVAQEELRQQQPQMANKDQLGKMDKASSPLDAGDAMQPGKQAMMGEGQGHQSNPAPSAAQGTEAGKRKEDFVMPKMEGTEALNKQDKGPVGDMGRFTKMDDAQKATNPDNAASSSNVGDASRVPQISQMVDEQRKGSSAGGFSPPASLGGLPVVYRISDDSSDDDDFTQQYDLRNRDRQQPFRQVKPFEGVVDFAFGDDDAHLELEFPPGPGEYKIHDGTGWSRKSEFLVDGQGNFHITESKESKGGPLKRKFSFKAGGVEMELKLRKSRRQPQQPTFR